jgi:hypothetical protein
MDPPSIRLTPSCQAFPLLSITSGVLGLTRQLIDLQRPGSKRVRGMKIIV